MAKLMRWLLLPLLIALVLLFASGYWLLHQSWPVTYAAEIAQQRVKGLVLEGVSGNLADGITISALRWQDEGIQAQVTDLALTLRLPCFYSLQLCVETLQADTVRVRLPGGDSSTDNASRQGATNLPEITLPFPVSIEQLQLQSLLIETATGLQHFSELSLRARWLLRKLELQTLSLAYVPPEQTTPWRLTGSGWLRFFSDYPLNVQLQLDTPTSLGRVMVVAEGNLQQLTLKGEAKGDWPLVLAGNVEPLVTPMPWTLVLNLAEKAIALPDGKVIQLQHSKASLRGTDREFVANLEALLQLPLWPGDNKLSTSLELKGSELRFADLEFQLPEGKVMGSGTVQLGEDFGGVTGQGDYALLSQWHFDALNPAQLLQNRALNLAGSLSGELMLRGTTRNQEDAPALESVSAQLDVLSGTLLGKSFTAQGQAAWQQESGLRLADVMVQQGRNQIALREPWQQGEPLLVTLSLPELGSLSDLLPGALSGAVEGALDIHLPASLADWQDLPRGQGKLIIEALSYDDLSVDHAAVQMLTSEARPYSVQVQATALRYQAQRLDTLSLSLQGDADAFALNAEAAMPDYGDLRLQCQGDAIQRITTAPTAVVCSRIRWQPLVSWPLEPWENVADVAWTLNLPHQTFTLQPFCLQELRADLTPRPTLCVDQPFRWQEGAAALAGTASGLSWLQVQPLLNPEWQVRGRLSGDIKAQIEHSQLLHFSASLRSDNTEIQLPVAQQQIFIPVRQLQTDIQGSLKTAELNLSLDAGDFGAVAGVLQIDRERQLQGRLTIRDLEVRTLQPFLVGVTELAGVVNGQLTLSGTIDQPAVNGEASIQQGIIHHPALPAPLTEIQLQTRFDTHQASYNGTLMLNTPAANPAELRKARARLSGELDWQTQPVEGWLQLSADEIEFSPMAHSTVWLVPDIRADYRDGQVMVTGQVTVPRAFINMKSLPKNSVSVSPDVVIVDADATQADAVPVAASVKLILGDAVRFRGFGLETKLKGTMRMEYSPQQLLQGNGYVQLVDGTYRAYGQNLAIRSGELIFVGPLDNPTIYVEAVRPDIPDTVTVGIRAEGPAQSPRVTLFSLPAMSDQVRLHYLITGRAPGEGAKQDSNALLSQAAISLGAATGETALQDYADKLGIQNFQLSAAEGDNGAEVQLSGYVNPRLYVRYGMGMFEKVNSLTMRYRLRRNLFLEAVSSTANTLDLLWTFQLGASELEQR